MTTRLFLALANFLGILALAAVVTGQWLREKHLRADVSSRESRIVSLQTKIAEIESRAAALESDITQLKEAVESSAAARVEAEKKLAELTATQATQITAATQATTAAEAAKDKIEEWRKAIDERDTRIKELNTALTATRARLDEAVAKLKAAAAR